ncbi:MAG: hypothetical protein A4E32_01310 [Methanomassiliicoccales archaeon PtaU1.Bin124]|nr:MAG: hypothetical protein A4E32_01310 [Methanomassiliicoccales archaeon PtaU1.Bin124]
MAKKTIECIDCEPGIPIESLRDRLVVNDKVAFIPGLEQMVEEVMRLKPPTMHQAGEELMIRVKKSYQIPPGEEEAYRRALLDYYDRRVTTFI